MSEVFRERLWRVVVALVVGSVLAACGAAQQAVGPAPKQADSPEGGVSATGHTSAGGQPFQMVRMSWVDCRQGGTRLTALDEEDDEAVNVPTGFPVLWGGVVYNSAWISTNGLVSLASGDVDDFSNENLPTTDIPAPAAAVLWDDWMTEGGGSVWVRTLGTAPRRVWAVCWYDLQGYPSSPSRVTFQALFLESQQVLYQYLDTVAGNFRDNGASATVGVQNYPGYWSVWSFNTPQVPSGLAIITKNP
ncbi:MAG: hypothetical protein QN144_13890 [Armatimonadota bacterium]|nr:hypothetical protein [Armatimonadota bacterium]